MAEIKKEIELEIAHVLFIDIVGYSKLLTNEQRERLEQLNHIVRATDQFRAADVAGKLVRLTTGDGMALAFFTSPDAPVRCALQIARALKDRSDLPLRMGIHSGPVDPIFDVNERPNIAGAGINIAQRVMDCGDAGHILLSGRAADDLAQHAKWKAQLHEIGEAEVKHGVRVRIFNLYDGEVGNAQLPQKLRRQRLVRRRRLIVAAVTATILIMSVAFGVWAWQRQTKLRAQAASEAAAKTAKSVAVLPFEDLSSDKQNTVLAGGVHREVLTNLAKIADLKVISRTSVMRYKPGSERNLKQIAQELGVAYVVEGSVQREADHVRVTAELIEASSDSNAWAETYDGQVADVLGIQSEIAQRISNQLGAKLSPRESADLALKPTKDFAAFENYIRACALMETVDNEDSREQFRNDNARAVDLLDQAVTRDPRFVAAYWALAEANIQLHRSMGHDTPEFRARAEAALKHAERLAPDAGETIHAQARIIYYGYHDFEKALATLERAAKSLPNNADISLTRAFLYRRFGRWQEAFAQFDRAKELNPQDPQAHLLAGMTANALRWYDDSDRIRDRMIKLFPRIARMARLDRIVSLRIRGDIEPARKEMERLHPEVSWAFLPLFYTAFWDRDFQEARRLVNEAGKFPEIQRDRWEAELRLAFVGHPISDKQVVLEAEKRLEEELKNPSLGEREGPLIETLTCVKFILGKKEEAIRLCESSVAKHPISEDALVNTLRVRWLAYGYVCAGDHERALQAFARLVQIPSGTWYGPLKFDPLLEDLRKDPRFDDILKQSQMPFPKAETVI